MTSPTSPKFKLFFVYEELEYGVLLPSDINYSNLVWYVEKKFKVTYIKGSSSLSYNIGSNTLYIIDDDDLLFFLNLVFQSTDVIQKKFNQ